MKAIFAALCMALAPAAAWGQSIRVSSVIPTIALIAGSTQPGRLPPLATSAPKLIAPAITRTSDRAGAPVAAAVSKPQCNMLIAPVRPDAEVTRAGSGGMIENRAVPILTQRAACINAFATVPMAETAGVPKP